MNLFVWQRACTYSTSTYREGGRIVRLGGPKKIFQGGADRNPQLWGNLGLESTLGGRQGLLTSCPGLSWLGEAKILGAHLYRPP